MRKYMYSYFIYIVFKSLNKLYMSVMLIMLPTSICEDINTSMVTLGFSTSTTDTRVKDCSVTVCRSVVVCTSSSEIVHCSKVYEPTIL